MKKLGLIVLAIAMVIGLGACSGALHDYEAPSADAAWGTWRTVTIDMSAAVPTGVVTAIISNPSAAYSQSANTALAASGAFYFDYNASGLTVSARSDKPADTSTATTLVLYVYTDAADVSAWVWDEGGTGGNFSGGTWPGVALN